MVTTIFVRTKGVAEVKISVAEVLAAVAEVLATVEAVEAHVSKELEEEVRGPVRNPLSTADTSSGNVRM